MTENELRLIRFCEWEIKKIRDEYFAIGDTPFTDKDYKKKIKKFKDAKNKILYKYNLI